MQTEAEKYLIAALQKFLQAADKQLKLLNIGAAQSLVIETALQKTGKDFVADRCDIQDCRAASAPAENFYTCPLEDMAPIPSAYYDGAFANFVLEHVSDPAAAAREMARVLKPDGFLVLSLSNPQAPEFILAKLTPTAFHQLFRQEDHDAAYPVKYAYRSIGRFIKLMTAAGFQLEERRNFAFTYGYLYRFPVLKNISRIYDKLLTFFGFNCIMSHSVLVFTKEH